MSDQQTNLPPNDVLYPEPLIDASTAAHLITWDDHKKYWARREMGKFGLMPNPRGAIIWLMGLDREVLWTSHGQLELTDQTLYKWRWRGIEYELPHLLRELPQMEHYIVTRTRYMIARQRSEFARGMRDGEQFYSGDERQRERRASNADWVIPKLDALEQQLAMCGLADAYADEARTQNEARRAKYLADEESGKIHLLRQAENDAVRAQRVVDNLREQIDAQRLLDEAERAQKDAQQTQQAAAD
jgi:hypothetical protein